MTNTQIYTRTHMNPTRRTALALLGAVAVVLAGVTTPLADTAHAGGRCCLSGDPPESKPPPKPKMVIGDPASTLGIDTAESQPGAGGVETLGSKPGTSGGSGATDPPYWTKPAGAGAIGESEPDAGTIETPGRKPGVSSGNVR